MMNRILLTLLCGTIAVSTAAASETASWRILGPGGGGATFIPTFSYSDPAKFLVRCDMTGTYLTENGGADYAQHNFKGGPAAAFAFDPEDSQRVYATSAGIHESTDGGHTWHLIFPKPDMIAGERYLGDHADLVVRLNDKAPAALDKKLEEILPLKVDPADSNRIYAGCGNALLWTTDGGSTWQSHAISAPIKFIYANKGDLADRIVAFTAKSLVSIDRKSGKVTETPLPASITPLRSATGGTDAATGKTRLYAVHEMPRESDVDWISSASDVWTSTDLGKSWQRLDSPVLNNKGGQAPGFRWVATSEFDSKYVYVVTDRYVTHGSDGSDQTWFGALRSADSGSTWEWVYQAGGGSGSYEIKDGHPAANLKDSWVTGAFGNEFVLLLDVGVDPHDGRIAIVTDWYRTIKTTDAGKTWNEVYSDLQPDGTVKSRGLEVTTCYGVHFDPFDAQHIGVSYTDIGYHQSFDGGTTWERSVKGIPPAWTNTCYWAVFDPEVKGKVWSVWSSMHDFPRQKMTRSPNWRKRGAGGVAVSTDGGRTWKAQTNGIGDRSPSTDIILDPRSPKDGRTLYVTCHSKGVFKSTDGGETWHLKDNGLDPSAECFRILLASDGTLYVVSSPGPEYRDGKPQREVNHGAVYRSTDGAESWHKLTIAPKAWYPNDISEDPNKPGRLYVAAWGDVELADFIGGNAARASGGNEVFDLDGGVWVSDDHGDTWKQLFDPKEYVYSVTPDPRHPGRLYAGTFTHAIFESTDYGATWHKMPGYDFYWGHRAIIDPHSADNIYFTTFGSSVWYGPHAR